MFGVAGPVLAVALTSSLTAQSESELRQETTRQNQRVNDLKSEVSALELRVRALEDLIARLQTELEALRDQGDGASAANAPTNPEAPDQSAAPVPSPVPAGRPADVFRDPATILETLRWDFRSDLTKDPSFALGINANSDRARTEATSILTSWILQMNRKFQQPVTWPIRIMPNENPDATLFMVQALTPDGTEVGSPFEMTISRPIQRRVNNWLANPRLERFLLKGTFLPQLSAIDPEQTIRTEPADTTTEPVTAGTEEDEVVQVSPYVRFEYSLRLSTILPVFEIEDGGEKEAPDGP
jgi:hypothetical protein